MNKPCEYLEWDSRFFEQRIGRVKADTLTSDTLAAVLDWSRAQSIDCLYFLARADDDQTIRLAETNGFHLVDLRVTLEAYIRFDKPSSIIKDITIRQHNEAEIPELRAIASSSYHNSRFYYDGHFPRERCDALYAVWIEKACRNPEQQVLVADVSGRPAGFITCERRDASTGQIGLLGVSVDFRGHGIGPALIAAALDTFRQQGLERVNVVTQGRNLTAQRSYQRSGFVTANIQLWYHRWFQR